MSRLLFGRFPSGRWSPSLDRVLASTLRWLSIWMERACSCSATPVLLDEAGISLFGQFAFNIVDAICMMCRANIRDENTDHARRLVDQAARCFVWYVVILLQKLQHTRTSGLFDVWIVVDDPGKPCWQIRRPSQQCRKWSLPAKSVLLSIRIETALIFNSIGIVSNHVNTNFNGFQKIARAEKQAADGRDAKRDLCCTVGRRMERVKFL